MAAADDSTAQPNELTQILQQLKDENEQLKQTNKQLEMENAKLKAKPTEKTKPAEMKHARPNVKKKPKTKVEQFLVDMCVGGVSGAFAKTVMAPFERVKILLMTQDCNPEILSGEKERYSGFIDCFIRVYAEQGFWAFWRGNIVNCLRYAPQQAAALAFNGTIRAYTPKFDPKTQWIQATVASLISGGLAGAIANTICFPFDFARTRLASDIGSGETTFSSMSDCIIKTISQQGIFGLYRGWIVTCAGAFVYRAGQLFLFSQIMAVNPYKDDKGAFGHTITFLFANVGRTAVMPLHYPFDTVRRRLMLESEKAVETHSFSGGIDCFLKTLTAEGVVGLYKGIGLELVRGIGGSLVIVLFNRMHLSLLTAIGW